MIARHLSDHTPDELQPFLAFEITLHGTPEAVRDGLATCMHKLGPLNLGPEKLSVVEIVMAETLNNIVEHAFCGQSVPRLVRLSCTHDGSFLSLAFKDSGSALPDHTLPRPKQFEAFDDLQNLPEGGFGWGLIHDLTDDVSYKRVGRFNSLTLKIEAPAN